MATLGALVSRWSMICMMDHGTGVNTMILNELAFPPTYLRDAEGKGLPPDLPPQLDASW